jgi:hypothetical protein
MEGEGTHKGGECFTVVINGQELTVGGRQSVSERLPYFRDPVISRFGRDTLTNADLDVKTTELFFSMVCNEKDFSFIPPERTPEHEQVRRGLSFLSQRYGFPELASELEKIFSLQSELFSMLFVVYVLRQIFLSDVSMKLFFRRILQHFSIMTFHN